MNRHLDTIRKAYDLTVEQYEKGIKPLDSVPQESRILRSTNSLEREGELLGSAAPDIKEYLAPGAGMRFLDAGCCANIANYRLDLWPSIYYGVDISPGLIEAMRNVVKRKQLSIGGLYVAEVRALPFDDNFFDIAAVIGVLEYCSLEYMEKSLAELNRVLKSGSRLVFDIPNENHPYAADMAKWRNT
jgi:SAM-dependent methyltransferase